MRTPSLVVGQGSLTVPAVALIFNFESCPSALFSRSKDSGACCGVTKAFHNRLIQAAISLALLAALAARFMSWCIIIVSWLISGSPERSAIF